MFVKKTEYSSILLEVFAWVIFLCCRITDFLIHKVVAVFYCVCLTTATVYIMPKLLLFCGFELVLIIWWHFKVAKTIIFDIKNAIFHLVNFASQFGKKILRLVASAYSSTEYIRIRQYFIWKLFKCNYPKFDRRV